MTNKHKSPVNIPENPVSNYRSTRRKRLFSESISQESSEDSAMTNMEDITTFTGSKRRRGRSSTAVRTATSAKQEEPDVLEPVGTKENRRPKGLCRSSQHSNYDGNAENTENSTGCVLAVAATEISEGNSSGDNEMCDVLQDSRKKLPLPKNVFPTKNTETKSRGRSIDSEIKLQKRDAEKNSTPTITTERSNSAELGSTSGDNEKCDIPQETKRKLPLPKNVSSVKKTEIKSRGKSTDLEVKLQKNDAEKNSTPPITAERSNSAELGSSSGDNEKCDVLQEAKRKLPSPKIVSSTKKTEVHLKSRGRSTDSEIKLQIPDTEKNSSPTIKTDRASSVELSFESDTDSFPNNTNQTARKRPTGVNRRKSRKKAVPDLLVDTSQDNEKATVPPETSSPQNRGSDQMTASRVAADVSSVDTVQKEKEEAADGERNQLPISSKSWRMRAVAQIRQCEVRLLRLTEAEVHAATERPKLEASYNSHGTASEESEVDSEPDVIIDPEPLSRPGTVFAPILVDEEDACSTISQSDTISGGGTPAHDVDAVNELRRMHLILVGHSGAILELVTVGRQAVAASEDGFVYCYSLKTGRLKRVVSCGSQPVTCLCVVESEEGQLIFAGSLDGHMRCFTFKSGTHIFEAVNVGAPIQCIDHNWGNVYMGNRDGTVAVFNTKTRQLLDPRLSCTDESILSLKTTKEGPRQVLLVACRNQPLTIRDAKTGLLMRTVSLDTTGSVYCTLVESSHIYCGTSNGKICIYEFTSGMEVHRLSAGVGVVVCLRLFRNLLFAGCYDGFIYIYNLQDKTLITRIPGPGKMIFCMEVVKNRVIAASKSNNRLEAWSFPPEIRKYFRDIKHR